jgi:hypothetical protein
LVKHAAAAERFWFQRFIAGLDEDECDGYATRFYLHMIEHHARHAGHGDILREQIEQPLDDHW